MVSQIDLLAKRLHNDQFFLASALADYARSEQLDERRLAGRLGCAMETLGPLQLCRRPHPDPSSFRHDVDRIVMRFGVQADVLAEAVRRADALSRLRQGDSSKARPLMAARDRQHGPLDVDEAHRRVPMPQWISETASTFWAAAGEQELFPRSLRRAIASALPLTVVLLSRLRVAAVGTWLREQGIVCGMRMRDRVLRACLVARYGQGIIFIDGTDPDDEQRFSLAHELAHFLRDYWQPRRIAIERLGEGILEVLDEGRPPRFEERVHALLGRAPLGFHMHLMERTADGHVAHAAIEAAERDADCLAFELLAPSAIVLEEAKRYPSEQRRRIVEHQLTSVYGLPAAPAAFYASLLVAASRQAHSFVRRLWLVRDGVELYDAGKGSRSRRNQADDGS